MKKVRFYKNLEKVIKTNPALFVTGLLIINFLIRIFIYHGTRLFSFSDYSSYLNGVENIEYGKKQYLLVGNFLFAISYIGYYAKYILGSIDYFFVFNCLMGTLSSLVIYIIVIRVTGLQLAGIITVIIHTLYTEFMVFSSVFYTPILMIFLLSLFLLFIYLYLGSKTRIKSIIGLLSALLVYLLTFFFKPELKYLPWFLLLPGLFFLKKNKSFSKKVLFLSFLLFTFSFLLQHSGLITQPKGNVISNSFVFFGHTDYGGDGGEGSFVYPENKARYEIALKEYLEEKKINNPTIKDYNAFQRQEIRKFISHHSFNWIGLQFTKFFRTFGVVPETTSFKILYTGLLKGNLWLTSIVVIAPVALIILMFILFFNFSAILQLIRGSTAQRLNGTKTQRYNSSPLNAHRSALTDYQKHFFYRYCLIFFYYIIATIFYGHYQERYRMPVMVVFIIPMLGYFIAVFDRKQFLNRTTLGIKGALIVFFLTVWIFQVKKVISNKERLKNAIESITGNQ